MIALAGAGRCDPLLIEAARGGDADALVSLIAIAQPDIRRYAARNCRAADMMTRFRKRCCCCTGGLAHCAW
jgi:hypothetical protein